MNTIAVYGIWNRITQRVYIGQSSNVNARFAQHLRSLRRGDHHSKFLQNSWNKYGEGAFEFRIIRQCDTKTDALELEQAFLDVHFEDEVLRKTILNGARSNDSAKLFSEAKSDPAHKLARVNGIRKSPEFYESVRTNLKKAWTEEANAKRVASTNKSGKWHASRWTPVIATSLLTGERMRFESIGEAARALGVWPGSIHRSISGTGKRAGNFTFTKAEKRAAA